MPWTQFSEQKLQAWSKVEISQKPFSKRILEVITLSTLHVVKSPGLQRAPENLVLAPSVLALYGRYIGNSYTLLS